MRTKRTVWEVDATPQVVILKRFEHRPPHGLADQYPRSMATPQRAPPHPTAKHRPSSTFNQRVNRRALAWQTHRIRLDILAILSIAIQEYKPLGLSKVRADSRVYTRVSKHRKCDSMLNSYKFFYHNFTGEKSSCAWITVSPAARSA